MKMNPSSNRFTKSYVHKFLNLIIAFPKLPRNVQKAIIKEMPHGFLRAVCEISLNLLNKNVDVNSSQKARLRRSRRIIHSLACKRTTLSRKRKLLLSGGGLNLLPLLFSTVIPFLTRLL